MVDGERIGNVNVTGGDFVGRDKVTNIYPPGSAPAELTPAQLDAAETLYRAQVIERYNRLGFAGLGVGDLRLSDVPLDDVFVRLTLTVEKTVREPIPPDEEPPFLTLPPLWGKGTRNEPGRTTGSPSLAGGGGQGVGSRQRERTITVQEPITLGDALTQHALIVGEPGAGKSTLLRWLAVTFAAGHQRETDRLGPQADADRLPLLVELGRLPEAYLQANSRETPNWKVFLPEHLTKQPPFDDIPTPFLEQALAQGRCLLLCDGLDEIADLSARRRMADSLADYARTSANRLVLSSRPAGVSGSEASLGARFQRLTIQRLAPEDVRRFFGFIYAQDSELTPDEAREEADRLYAVVESQPKTLELATTPLLATLLLLLWNQDGYLPERRVELYERCCQMLIESWEVQHDVAYTGVLAEIGWERHLRLLAPLAYAIHNTGQRTDAPASELIPVLALAMQTEGLAPPASATLEAEKFLRTLSLRSGLLQFLGTDENSQGRYGFPHLTFQEYLTARYIAAQPDPDYIDTVMVHLHKAWWREVHLLVIGHLGSGSEGAEKTSKLLGLILHLYRPPWQVLRSQRFNRWVPRWLRKFVSNYREYRILQLPIYGFGIVVLLVSVPFLLAANFLAARVKWQFERRLAWILAREFSLAVTGFFDFSSLGVDTHFCNDLANDAQHLLLQIVLDPGRMEDFDSAGLLRHAAAGTLRELGEVSEQVVSVLVDELLNSDLDARCVAADSLGLLGQASEDVVSALVQNLGESEWFVRQAATDSLVQLGISSDEVVAMLLDALRNSSKYAREAAAQILRQSEKTSGGVLPALVSALSDSVFEVRHEAATSLVHLAQQSEEVVTALVDALGAPEWPIRKAAALSLGELGQASGDVVAMLIDGLNDSDFEVRCESASSLGKLGYRGPEAVSTLIGALNSTNDSFGGVRTAAAKSLGQIGQDSPDVVTALVDVLSDAEWGVMESASESLGQLGQGFSEAVPILVGMMNAPEWYVRDIAVKSLAYVGKGSSEAISALVVAMDDPEWVVRETAIKSLAHVGQGFPEAMSALIAAMDDPEWYVRKVAVESLAHLGQGEPEAVLALIGALSDSSDDLRWATERALTVLGQVSLNVVIALFEALGNSELGVRIQAARILVKLENVPVDRLPVWLELLFDPDFILREVAANALGALGKGSPDVILALMGALDDSVWPVRHAAANGLVRLGYISSDVVKALVGMINESGFLLTRIHIVSSLGVIGQKFPEVESALTIALTDPEWEIRESAAKSLGKLGTVSEATLMALEQALKDSQKGYGYPATYPVREAALDSLGQLNIEDETQLRTVLIALNSRLHDRDDDVRGAALTAIRQLLDGRQIPGYRWVPIREQQRRARIRRRIGLAVLALGLVVLALCSDGVVNGQLDFAAGWVRVVGGLAGLSSLAAGVDLWLAHRRRPPWDR